MEKGKMDFFKIMVPDEKQHANFKSVLHDARHLDRQIFSQWADGFIDRDGKIVKEFQTTFNSTFWEVYLYRVFKELDIYIDWHYPSPDFSLSKGENEFIVEAVVSNSADGKINEWEKTFTKETMDSIKRFKKINHEAMIRLSNSILSKHRLYVNKYKNLGHVKGKPFVIAVAPFEQPWFNLQYTRPICSVLYDHYVDEDEYLDNPGKYQKGPPVKKLGFIEKDNGAEIQLGLFTNDRMKDVSAVIFSCTATWGKLSAMKHNFFSGCKVDTVWSIDQYGTPEKRSQDLREYHEKVVDGLCVFHNPYATYPLSPEIFNNQGIAQYNYFVDDESVHAIGVENSLLYRSVVDLSSIKGKSRFNFMRMFES